MARLYVIQRGRTDWDDQDRMENLAGVPLNAAGQREIGLLAGELVGRGLSVVYSGLSESEQESARLLGQALHLPVRSEAGLAGLDFGLWQALTGSEVAHRHGRLWRQWRLTPGQVCPPGGLSPGQSQQQLCAAVRALCRRHRHDSVLLVLAPTAMALLRAALEHVELDRLWELVEPAATWSSYDTNGQFGLEDADGQQ